MVRCTSFQLPASAVGREANQVFAPTGKLIEVGVIAAFAQKQKAGVGGEFIRVLRCVQRQIGYRAPRACGWAWKSREDMSG